MFDWDTVGGYGPEQTAGHSGSKTSEAAALRPKGKRMKSVYEHLEDLGHVGATCEEVENFFEIGHGAASGALTRLHRGEYVERLAETRGGQEVYVLPSEVRDREVSPYRPNAAYREDRRPMPLEGSEDAAHRPERVEWKGAVEIPAGHGERMTLSTTGYGGPPSMWMELDNDDGGRWLSILRYRDVMLLRDILTDWLERNGE